MARVPQVTRTITSTKVNLMCVNTEAGEVFNQTIVMPRTYKDEKKLLKAIQKKYEDSTTKVVDIISSEKVTAKYAMTEQDFVVHATMIDD